MPDLTFAKALAALEVRQEARIELGLGRLNRHLKRLGDPQKRLRCFHVAGTNGKGSVCAILDCVLRAGGWRTGLYTSPHLSDVRERIQIEGRPISRGDFARFLSRALRADPQSRLTYFELLTSVAFQAFDAAGTEFVVLETGLGGRLDATNVIERPVASLITSIDFDHMGYLGDSLGKIAAEKAGIIKAGRPVFCADLAPAALKVIRGRARAAGAALTVVPRPWRTVSIVWRRNEQTLARGRQRYRLSLLGERQGRNAALAAAALEGACVGTISQDSWRKGLGSVKWPGRFEVLPLGKKTAILDGAHNAEAMGALVDTLRASPWRSGRLRWIMGVMKDKDYSAIIRRAAPFLREVVTVRPPSLRALDALSLAREVRRHAPRARVSVESDPDTALRSWLSTRGTPKTALVTGSFYLVGRAARFIERSRRSS